MEILFIVTMVTLFTVVLALVIWTAIRNTRRVHANLVRLAGNLGLRLDPPDPPRGLMGEQPCLLGSIRGKAVKIDTYTTGSGKSQSIWTEVEVTPVLTGDMTFSITREGIGTRFLKMFGAKEIKVGDREFDDAWFVQTNRPEFLRAALLPELQQKFRPFRGAFKLESGLVTYTEQGLLTNEATCHRFELATHLACDLADVAEVHARHDDRG
jgi:hypothetical protein